MKKSIKNDAKIHQKSIKNSIQKLVGFWSRKWSQNGSQNEPRSPQRATKNETKKEAKNLWKNCMRVYAGSRRPCSGIEPGGVFPLNPAGAPPTGAQWNPRNTPLGAQGTVADRFKQVYSQSSSHITHWPNWVCADLGKPRRNGQRQPNVSKIPKQPETAT